MAVRPQASSCAAVGTVSETETCDCESPYGKVELSVRAGRLVGARLCREDEPGQTGSPRPAPSREMAGFLDALGGYFEGRALRLEPEAFELSDATPFEARVYTELRKVPFGEVVTYGELAARAGSPRGARAVGQAVGRNPLPIFIPCHRVVAAGGRLGGFGAGLEWKRSLLTHEGWTVKEGTLMKAKPDADAIDICVYAGSFDPPTNGHMYMIEKGAGLFDRLIVSVGINPKKAYTFSVEERLEMLRQCTRHLDNVEVGSFVGQFLVRYAESRGAGYVLRGVRSEEDYRFEHAMRNVNEDLAPDVTTVFLIPPREICEISSSFVKGLVGVEGWQEVIKPYVPEPVYEKLLARDIRWTQQSAGAEGAAD